MCPTAISPATTSCDGGEGAGALDPAPRVPQMNAGRMLDRLAPT